MIRLECDRCGSGVVFFRVDIASKAVHIEGRFGLDFRSTAPGVTLKDSSYMLCGSCCSELATWLAPAGVEA